MTSDAKIGLLLGLVFIFVIAFIINGLPGSREKQNSNELTTKLVGSQGSQTGLAARQRRVPLAYNQVGSGQRQRVQLGYPSADEQEVRFSMPLPKTSPSVTETVETATPVPESVSAAARQVVAEAERQRRVLPRFYVVQDGDNLSRIAVKLYGPLYGNKLINVKRIFETNHNVLGSADEVYVGQKLVIPPPADSQPDSTETAGVLSGPGFVEVESVGKRHAASTTQLTQRSKVCLVREGDSLWQIAAEQLGDPSRYREIAKLNSDVIKNEDELMAGMRLRLPAK